MTFSRYSFLMFVTSAWIIFPLYLVTITTLGGPEIVFEFPKSFLPHLIDLSTIRTFLSVTGVWQAMFNSVVAALMTMVFSLVLGVPAGYALARYSFKGKNSYRVLILLTRAFPVAVLALPLASALSKFGLYDTLFAVALAHTGLALPFAVLVTASLFMGVPRELEEAAWTLGCTPLSAFFKVVMPIALPGIAATALFSFVISWNEVFAASILTTQNRTLTAFILGALDQAPMDFKFAGGFFLIIPAVIFIFFIRKHLFSMWGVANH